MLAQLIALGVFGEGDTPTPTPIPGSLTMELVKQHLRVLHDDEDDIIAQYIAASANHVEQYTGNLLSRRQVTQEFSCFSSRMKLYWGPSPSGAVFSYLDSDDAEVDLSDARIVRDSIYAPVAGWPSTAQYSPVFLTYEAGYADGEVPSSILSAQLLLIGHWFNQREAVNVGSSVAEVPLAVDALLGPYRRVMV